MTQPLPRHLLVDLDIGERLDISDSLTIEVLAKSGRKARLRIGMPDGVAVEKSLPPAPIMACLRSALITT